MPKTKTTSKNQHRVPFYRRPIIVASALILLVVIVVGVVIFCIHQSQPESGSSPEPSVQSPLGEQDQGVPSSATPDSPNQRPTAYEGEDPNQLEELTGSIPFKNTTNGVLSISATIDQYLINAGTCTLTLSQNGQSAYTETVAAVADVTTSVCETFHIPTANLPAGSYQIKIIITGDNKTGTIIDEVNL